MTVGASETLEYAIDDVAIARMAQALGDHSAPGRHGAALAELAEPLQPHHRLRPGPAGPTAASRPDRPCST